MNKILDFFYIYLTNRGIDVTLDNIEDYDLIKSCQLDSFDLMSLLVEAEIELGIKLEPKQILNNSTIKEIASEIISTSKNQSN